MVACCGCGRRRDPEMQALLDTATPPKPSMWVVQLTVLLSSMGFTVVLPTLFFYLEYVTADQHLSAASTQQFLGLVVGIYSVGQFVGSLFFGFWGNRRRTIEPLIVSLLILTLANVYYSLAEDFPSNTLPRQWHLFISRLLVGFGAGNVATCRAFVSEASTLENRTTAMTITGAAQGMGFVLGPALGFALSFMPRFHVGAVTIDGFTAAGLSSALLSIFNLLLLKFFVDIPSKKVQGKERVRAPPMTRSELGSMLLVMWIFFVILTGFSLFETITGPLTQFFFGWTDKFNGLLILAAGFVSVFVFFALGLLNKKYKFDDRKLVLYGLAMMTLSNVAGVPFWGSDGLHVFQIMLSAVCVALGYPVASAIAYALFSKVIAPVAQGDKMGYLTAGGSLARMLGPIWATALFDLAPIPVPVVMTNATFPNQTVAHHGSFATIAPLAEMLVAVNGTTTSSWGVRGYPGAWMFMTMAALNFVTILMMLVWWRTLVPHPDYRADVPATSGAKTDDEQNPRIN